MKQPTQETCDSLTALSLSAMRFDTAKAVPMYATSRKLRQKQLKGIWNVEQDKLASVASKNYNIVQHREFVEGTAKALQRLNLKSRASYRNSGNKVIVDIEFLDNRLHVQKGEEFFTGVRLVNSYDKTTGVQILPRLVRLVCNNGMVMNVGGFKSFNVRHNNKLAEDFEKATKKVIDSMVRHSEPFKALVERCLIDSVEWALMDRALEHLFKTEKHKKAIKKILRRDTIGKPTRWDLYNAVTDYVSHNDFLSVGLDIRLQSKAKKILTTPMEVLIPKKG